MKCSLRSEGFKRKFSIIIFVYNLMTGYSSKKRENYPRKTLKQKDKETWIKFNPGLALLSSEQLGPGHYSSKKFSCVYNKIYLIFSPTHPPWLCSILTMPPHYHSIFHIPPLYTLPATNDSPSVPLKNRVTHHKSPLPPPFQGYVVF